MEEDAGDVGDEARAPPWRAPPRWKCTGKGKRERRARLGRLTSLRDATSVFDSPGSSVDTGSVGVDTPMTTASQESVGSEASQEDWGLGSQESGEGGASSQGSDRGRPDKWRAVTWRRRRLRRLAAEFKAASSDVASSQEARDSDEEAEEEASQEP